MTTLEYVGLVVNEPEASAAFFADGLGLDVQHVESHGKPVPLIAVGASALALFDREDENLLQHDASEPLRTGVNHIALGAEAPAVTARGAGFGALPVTIGFAGRDAVTLPTPDTFGVNTRLVQPLAIAPARSDFVERIDHLGVASTDNHGARALFCDRLGCEYESEQTDSEFETISTQFVSGSEQTTLATSQPVLRGSLRVTFITAGDAELEFLQDLCTDSRADDAAHDVAGNTRGDRSAVARYVDRRGPGLHHLALKTPDIDALLAHLNGLGVRLIDQRGRPGSRRARIGFVHPSATGGVLVHFVQREEV